MKSPIGPADDAISLVFPPRLIDEIVDQVAARVALQGTHAEPWVGVAEVAEHLACKPQRIYDLVCRRRSSGIPHRKEGSRLLFRLSQIDAWVEGGGAA